MAITAIAQDFEVKQGLIVLGTSVVTSSTGNTSTLQVNGGAAIAKNLIVGTTAEIWSTTTLHDSLIAVGISASGKVIITDTTAAATTPDGALQVTGGVYIGNNAIISSVASSTSTVAGNALIVQGGIGVAGTLYVQGKAVFENDVLFTGDTTYVFSTNTVYTDNLIELHTHETGIGGAWAVDDGLDIGLRIHYYDGADKNAALILANDTKFLEFYSDGIETNGTFTSAVYGTFKTGNLVLTGNASVAGTVTATTFVGALSQSHTAGAGLTGSAYNGSTEQTWTLNTATLMALAVTATNIAGGTANSIMYQSVPGATSFLAPSTSGYLLQTNGSGSAPTWVSLDGVSSGFATTATNLSGGATGQIPYQSNTGSTTFSANLAFINGTNTLQVTNIATTGTTNATSPTTGALVVTGGVGIGSDLYVGGTIYGSVTTATTATTVLTRAQTANANYYPTFVDSDNATATGENVYTTSSFIVNAQTGLVTLTGDLAVNGGDITTTAVTFNIGNTAATVQTLNLGTAATANATTKTINLGTGGVSGSTTNLTVGSSTGGANTNVTFNQSATSLFKVQAVQAPTTDMFQITNTGFANITAGVNAFNVQYIGGAAAVEASAARIDITPGTLTGGTWSALRVTPTAGAATGVIQNGVKFDNITAGAGTDNALWVGTGWDNILSYNGTAIINGTGDVLKVQTIAQTANAVYYPAFVDSNNATATAESVYTTSSFTINAQTGNVAIASTTVSTTSTNGALVVTGGVGIGGATNIGGKLLVNDAANAISLASGAIQTLGGIAVTKDVYAGGAITAGATLSVTTSTVVPALYTNNLLLATFTRPNISGTTLQNLDVYSSSAYRSAKYFIQIVDGTSIHISEITVFHDGTNVYINEYGISTNNGQLGFFDAVYDANVTLNFTPTGATNMTIKVVRMGITI